MTPAAGAMTPTWRSLLEQPDDGADLRECYEAAQVRRAASPVKVGSLDFASMRLLRAFCALTEPRVIAEVGTGLGASTFALRASLALYTCDKNHDLVTATDTVTPHPRTLSTEMLQVMVRAGLAVDLFFFDGRIHTADLPLILALSTPQTSYLFDDYLRSERREEKGMANVGLLSPLLPTHQLVLPVPETRNQIAGLLPASVYEVLR